MGSNEVDKSSKEGKEVKDPKSSTPQVINVPELLDFFGISSLAISYLKIFHIFGTLRSSLREQLLPIGRGFRLTFSER